MCKGFYGINKPGLATNSTVFSFLFVRDSSRDNDIGLGRVRVEGACCVCSCPYQIWQFCPLLCPNIVLVHRFLVETWGRIDWTKASNQDELKWTNFGCTCAPVVGSFGWVRTYEKCRKIKTCFREFC